MWRKNAMTRGKALALLIGLLFGAPMAAWIIRQACSRPELAGRVGAWWSGAEYLGIHGVEMQRSSNDCGPTALKMVCDHFGVTDTGEIPGEGMRLARRGVTLRQLQRAAAERGLACLARPITYSELSAQTAPAIALLRSRHFVVIDRADPGGFVYARDPSLGKLRYSREAFERIWTGLALIFPEQKAKSAAHLVVLCNVRPGG
jgi:hypothetical protein